MMAENILAHAKALYKGHAVAAVAATSPHIAEGSCVKSGDGDSYSFDLQGVISIYIHV